MIHNSASTPLENKESTTLIWFDPNIGLRDDTEETKQQLRTINDYVKFYTDLELCIRFIESINKEKIFLITSGSRASEILPHISALCQIDSVFIYCMKMDRYHHLTNKYGKIIGIYNNLTALCTSIREQIDLFDKQLQAFSFFDQHKKSIKDLSKQSAEFLWFQLFRHVILRLPQHEQAKQQMINICRHYYRGNAKEFEVINQFERAYRAEEAIRWYSKESFVYKLLNKALRSEDIDQLHTFRFFIGDLSESLAREHEKILLSKEQILTVYRGGKLDKAEFDKLKENQGKLISTNGYLSTSRFRSRALTFALKPTGRTDVVSVLFQIECNIKELGKHVIFADIATFSEYPDEHEVLFDLSTPFRLESIEEDGGVQLIRMSASSDGETITKDYIELIHRETEEKSVVIIFGKLMCDLGKYDKSQKYFEQLLKDPNGEDLVWINFNIGRALHLKGEWKEAREYYDRVYDQMVNDKPARIKESLYVLNNIGLILNNQERYDESLDYHQQALKLKETYYPSDHIHVATSLHNIGLCLYKQEKYENALDYYRRALNINQKYYPSVHPTIALNFNNIAIVLQKQGEHDEALTNYQQALQMQEQYYPTDHIDTAISLHNIGNLLRGKKMYDQALDYYVRALEIQEKHYLSGHTDIATTLCNIGFSLYNQKKYQEALDYYRRSLKMLEKYYPSNHRDITDIQNNIELCYQSQEKSQIVFDQNQLAFTTFAQISIGEIAMGACMGGLTQGGNPPLMNHTRNVFTNCVIM